MTTEMIVENIKCGGCANSISQALSKLKGVSHVDVNVAEGKILLEGNEDMDVTAIKAKLQQMGYPEPGKGSVLTTASSFVSCMIGRVS
jgi:copper chaperone